MNVLKFEKQVAVINALVEGVGVRAASRMLNVSIPTILALLVRVGSNCERIMEDRMKQLDCRYLELDELWTFCGKKQARLRGIERENRGLGDQYLFFAIDNETKLVPAWALGKRTAETAGLFLNKLRGTLNGVRPQITTDGWAGYTDTMGYAFGTDNIDYAQLVKVYEAENPGPGRYSPPRVSEVMSTVIHGSPEPEKVCTSIVERSNLTVRTFQRRFTRLALGFSKKLENLRAACALHFAYYNFCWVPRTIRTTPAMAAGVANSPWVIADLIGDC